LLLGLRFLFVPGKLSGFAEPDAPKQSKTTDQRSKTKRSKIMFLGKVVGTVWSTKKSPDLEGVRFLIVHPFDLDKEPNRSVIVVADRLGAGAGETVMCAFGKAARTAIGNQEMAIEAAVVGIVDRVDLTESLSDELRAAARELARDNGRA
jgi:ethanolamine utilization protein EutN